MGFNENPWLFGAGGTLSSLAGRVSGVVWLAATALLVSSGVGLLTNQAWWTSAAVAGVIVSLAAVIPWWKTVVSGARIGVLLDVLILVGLLTPLKSWVFQFFKLS